MGKCSELRIFKDTEIFINTLYNAFKTTNKFDKYSICVDIRNKCLELLDTIYLANKTLELKERKDYINNYINKLSLIILRLRHLKDVKSLTEKQSELIIKLAYELYLQANKWIKYYDNKNKLEL